MLERRAAAVGTPDCLLERGRRLSVSAPTTVTIAYFRLLRGLGSGDRSRLPFLMRKFRPVHASEAELLAVLELAGYRMGDVSLEDDRREFARALATPIAQELDMTGASTLLEWAIRSEVYRLDDVEFQQLVRRRVELALEHRRQHESAPIDDAATADRNEAIRLLIDTGRSARAPLFLIDHTLLEVVTGRRFAKAATVEFGTLADITDVARCVRSAGFDVETFRPGHIVVTRVDHTTTVTIRRFESEGDVLMARTSRTSQWHRTFASEARAFNGTDYEVPTDAEHFLSERFGNWETPTLFAECVLDAPNVMIEHTLDALFDLSRATQHAFRHSIRFHAEHNARHLRDVFDIDFSLSVPQPVHRKALSTPLPPREALRGSTLIAGSFDRLDAAMVQDLQRAADQAAGLVVAIRRPVDGSVAADRLAAIRLLRSVDRATLYSDAAELAAAAREHDASHIMLDHNADLDLGDPAFDSLTTKIEPWRPENTS